jgi:hypothetical protein
VLPPINVTPERQQTWDLLLAAYWLNLNESFFEIHKAFVPATVG